MSLPLGFKTDRELGEYLKCLKSLKVGDKVHFYIGTETFADHITDKTHEAEVVFIRTDRTTDYDDSLGGIKFRKQPTIMIGSIYPSLIPLTNYTGSYYQDRLVASGYPQFIDLAEDIRVARIIKVP